MIRLPRLVIAAAVSALAIAALAAPAAAADPEVAIVQGIPGVRADVCVDGDETRSALPYGRTVFRTLAPGVHTIKVFKQDARECRGTKLLRKTITLAADADVTLVATQQPPKLVEFDNSLLGSFDYASDVYFRHAADLGGAVMGWLWQGTVPIAPSAPTPLQKGEQGFAEHANALIRVFAQRRSGVTLAVSRWVTTPVINDIVTDTYGNTRIEFILVGTNAKNARFVTSQRPAP